LSWTLEGTLNDFGIAQFATAMASGEHDAALARRYREEAEYFYARAADYVRLFDPATGFFRGRDAEGKWRQSREAFDPRVWGGDYTEANAWNFVFSAAHDVDGLATLVGGRDALARRLDQFFATPETAEARFAGSYGQVIHEMTEARDVRLGLYAHSNQPSHHIPWMYVGAGQPWKTQRITREVVRRLYLGSEIGQGYPGDEDNGEMSAWYLFAMLGLYPLRMGAPEYVIGSPAFDRVDVRLDSGRTLTVVARDNGPENVYVQSLKVNGESWKRPWIPHDLVAAGGMLEFQMGSTPSSWGSGADVSPRSMTAPGSRPSGFEDLSGSSVAAVSNGGGSAAPLVDDDASTSLSLQASSTVSFAFADPAEIGHYTITMGDSPPRMFAWTLEGRDDKGRWAVLDRRLHERFEWKRQLRPFRVANPGAYHEYRLRFETSAAFDLAELELLVPGTGAPASRAAPETK
jgi:hypothetical protein